MQKEKLFMYAGIAFMLAAVLGVNIVLVDAAQQKKVKDLTCNELNDAFVKVARYHVPHPSDFFNCGPNNPYP